MIEIHIGNMWDTYDEAELFLITANSYVKQDGHLIMGAGIALEAKERFPGVDLAMGKHMRKHFCRSQGDYYVMISDGWPEKKLGLFQVKRHFSEPADLQLIELSAAKLAWMMNNRPWVNVHMNFPGIGAGKQSVFDVVKSLHPLMEPQEWTVHMWMTKNSQRKIRFEIIGRHEMKMSTSLPEGVL
jgi:hypothetical protein